MNTKAILKMAKSAGVNFSLNGDKLALQCAAKPPGSLLEAIKADKVNIVAILRKATARGLNCTTVNCKPPGIIGGGQDVAG